MSSKKDTRINNNKLCFIPNTQFVRINYHILLNPLHALVKDALVHQRNQYMKQKLKSALKPFILMKVTTFALIKKDQRYLQSDLNIRNKYQLLMRKRKQVGVERKIARDKGEKKKAIYEMPNKLLQWPLKILRLLPNSTCMYIIYKNVASLIIRIDVYVERD